MWEIKKFKNADALARWREANGHRYQIVEIFVNNGYALEVRKLRMVG